ncbi:HAD family hydrolase [Paracoccus aminophilus]|uniref:Hydrolase n=1 Tax=Paracoccus aminophilus JCM 7686 TaxID=1367847 RepID=S5Y5J3_PARAH|nr:HAD family phosphatase [Paracoccus aminophilus]AGT10985.1 hydrolase [Paracoccus aminophilus JCM 7686]
MGTPALASAGPGALPLAGFDPADLSPMRRIEAVLFDCDGVLLDSEPLSAAALAQAISAAGVTLSAEEAGRLFSGTSGAVTQAWLAQAGLDAAKVFAEADARLFAMFDQAVPQIPGVEAVLAALDLPIAVCSNSMLRRLERSLMASPLAAYFGRHIYSADHVARAKPAPDLVLHAARALGVAPEAALFIDDTPHGLAAGVAAGCLAVGFVGPSERRPDQAERLRAAGAHHIVCGMAEFHALLARLLPLAPTRSQDLT